MKTVKMFIKHLALLGVTLAISSCASNDPKSTPQAQSPPPANQKDMDPEVGMTKEQVIARYGKTDRISSSSDGEVWTYMLNLGQAFIPFNFGYHPKILIIVFDNATGKVAHWNYSR